MRWGLRRPHDRRVRPCAKIARRRRSLNGGSQRSLAHLHLYNDRRASRNPGRADIRSCQRRALAVLRCSQQHGCLPGQGRQRQGGRHGANARPPAAPSPGQPNHRATQRLTRKETPTMKNLNRRKRSHATQVAASVAAVAAVVAGAAGIAAGQGNAAPALKAHEAHRASYQARQSEFKRPKLRHGVLTVAGTEASDKIALRLQAGRPGILQVDVGDDGSADFSFERTRRREHRRRCWRRRRPRAHRREQRRLHRQHPHDPRRWRRKRHARRRLRRRDAAAAAPGTTRSTATAATTSRSSVPATTRFVWDPGDGSDTVEGQDGTDTMLFNGANGGRAGRPVGEREPAQVLPRPGQHHDGHRRRRDGRLQRPRRRRHGHRQRPHRHRRQDRQRRPGSRPRRHHRRRRRPTR